MAFSVRTALFINLLLLLLLPSAVEAVQKNNIRALVGVLVDRDLGYSGTKFFHIMILNLVRQSARWVSGTSGFGFLLTHSVSLSHSFLSTRVSFDTAQSSTLILAVLHFVRT